MVGIAIMRNNGKLTFIEEEESKGSRPNADKTLREFSSRLVVTHDSSSCSALLPLAPIPMFKSSALIHMPMSEYSSPSLVCPASILEHAYAGAHLRAAWERSFAFSIPSRIPFCGYEDTISLVERRSVYEERSSLIFA